MSWQTIDGVRTSREKINRERERKRSSTGRLGSCSERIMKLALPSMHLVTSVLREHFEKLSREQIGRLEKLLQQIQAFHRKNNREELIKTLNDFGPSEKEKLLKIIGNAQDKSGTDEIKLPSVKSASDTLLIGLDKKLKFLYSIEDEEKFECQSSEDFLIRQRSDLDAFKMACGLQRTPDSRSDKRWRKNLQCEREHLRRTNKKSTVTIYTQYSDQTVTTYDTAPSRSLMLHSPQDEEEDTKILFLKKRGRPVQTWRADIEHVRGDYARIRQHRRKDRLGPPVHYCRRLARIIRNIYYLVTYEIVEVVTKCLNQIWNVDNYVYCVRLSFTSWSKLKPLVASIIKDIRAVGENPKHFELAAHVDSINRFCSSVLTYLIPPVLLRPITIVGECFCGLMFSYDEEDLIELNSANLKILKAKSRRKRKCRYSVQVQNMSSILQ